MRHLHEFDCSQVSSLPVLFAHVSNQNQHVRKIVTKAGVPGEGWGVDKHRLFLFEGGTLACNEEDEDLDTLFAKCRRRRRSPH